MNIREAFNIVTPPQFVTPIARARDHLLASAEKLEPRIANMLRVCADALHQHPEPIKLCERNCDRLFLSFDGEQDDNAPPAVDRHLAALAFERAASYLKGEVWP